VGIGSASSEIHAADANGRDSYGISRVNAWRPQSFAHVTVPRTAKRESRHLLFARMSCKIAAAV
jgi:hypothetical protein